ncbi:MAG: DUF1080 domain-containing protein [Bacteroides sp.]|nr:DUF1080 domain-containing protein [Bacteroides sp.]
MSLHKVSTIIILALFTLGLQAQDAPLSDYRWTAIDATGDVKERHEDAFIEYKDKFYLMGGRGINPVNVFDPATNSWETRGNSPMEIHHFQAVVYGDAIYLMGAMTGGYPKELPLENIWIYYPEEDRWEQGDEIPEAKRRGGAGAALYKDKIYMVCGIDYGHTSGTTNDFDSYDLKTGQWESYTKAPHIRDHFPAIVVDHKLYCVGGRNTSVHFEGKFGAFFAATMPWVDVYDFESEKWLTLENPLPYPTAAGGLVEIDNHLIYMGGEGSFPMAYNQTQSLDLESGQWSQLATLTTGRHGSGAILYKDQVYIAAGSPNQGGGNLNTIEVFSASHDWVSIFNGESLEGWSVKCVEKDKDREFWTVDKGTLLGSSMGSTEHDYMWLQSDGDYGDFELRLKFQPCRKSPGNAGVQIRSRYDEQEEWLNGPQVDINPPGPWRNGLIYDETRGHQRWISPSLKNWAIDSATYAPPKVVQYYSDEGPGWNDLTIICKGTHILTIVNNILVSDYDGSGVLDDEAHQKYKVGMSGHIVLQLHKNNETLIRFKDIEIRELN